MSHTKGPWKIHECGEHITSRNGKIICELTEASGDSVQGQTQRIKANASLIAASPDMKQALDIALLTLSKESSEATIHDTIAVIKQAIAKAEGKT